MTTTTTTPAQDIITAHGITATSADWRACGLATSVSGPHWHGTTDRVPDEQRLSLVRGAEQYLLRAAGDGRDGPAALAAAAREREAVMASCATREAARAEAAAITALADAIRASGEEAALERIISRLSERTQYAVRQQLRDARGSRPGPTP